MSAEEMFIKNLLGKSVIDSDAKTVGKIKDIVFSTESWSITEVHIKLDGNVKKELDIGGFGSKTVKTPPSYIKKLGDVVGLRIPVTELVETCEVD